MACHICVDFPFLILVAMGSGYVKISSNTGETSADLLQETKGTGDNSVLEVRESLATPISRVRNAIVLSFDQIP